jgi:hypothetical protein
VHAEVARLGINGAGSKREGQSRENAERLHGRILSMSISLTRNTKQNIPQIVAIGKTEIDLGTLAASTLHAHLIDGAGGREQHFVVSPRFARVAGPAISTRFERHE